LKSGRKPTSETPLRYDFTELLRTGVFKPPEGDGGVVEGLTGAEHDQGPVERLANE
jgi:hypothetical protein